MISVGKIKFNYEEEAIGVMGIPNLSWKLYGKLRNLLQVKYEIQVSLHKKFDDIYFETGWIEDEKSTGIKLEGFKITSLTTFYMRVRVQTNYGDQTDWSEVSQFTTGYLDNKLWKGKFVTAETINEKTESAGTYIRKEFDLRSLVAVHGEVKKAILCSTALGIYHIYLNGKKVGLDQMAPGWTSYNKHLLYQVYDVTAHLNTGKNMIGAFIGAGWYKGLMGFLSKRNNYGEQTALLADLTVWFEDGESVVVATDTSWKGHKGPVVFSEIYDGEIYDARLEIAHWNEPTNEQSIEFDEFVPTQIVPFDVSVLMPQAAGRVAIQEKLPVVEVIVTPNGETVLDFGQNLTGWITVSVTGQEGDKVELRCFETLDAAGNAYFDNLRKAKATLVYICNGKGETTYSPYFTFQGFRYVQVVSYPGQLQQENFIANVVYTKMEHTGWFECSNADINQLQHNITWGLKGNFLDIPSDCPQRDERMGWTGDAQIFCRTASYIMNTYTFFSKWLRDVAADQTEEGGVPHVVPDIITCQEPTDWLLGQGTHSAAAWADVAVINPWTLYLTYGDTEILEIQYDSMKAWINFMQAHANGIVWNYKLQFGDWVALDAEEGSYFGATPNDLTCTAYYAYSTGLFAKISRVLGKDEDAIYYNSLYKEINKGYQELFFHEDGSLTAQTQTAHIISLYFDLVPDGYKEKVTNDLILLLEKENGHLVTGFVGTPYFCHALSQNGKVEEAYQLLLKDDFPSWLYQVKMGATTVWEHWDGIKPDGTMWSPKMNSFNHYAYGAIGEWLYRVVAGIEIDEQNPGYKHFFIQPKITKHLEYVMGCYESVYGTIKVNWKWEHNRIRIHVVIPANTTATIRLYEVEKLHYTDGLTFLPNITAREGTVYEAEAGSGDYYLEYQRKE